MSKYFKESQVQEQKLKLSEYLDKDCSEFKKYICEEPYRTRRTKHLIKILGDVEFDEEMYRLFIKEYSYIGGKYDVRTKPETITGVYEFLKRYPSLTADALDLIWHVYIKDQFEEYALTDMFGKYIELYGETEEGLQEFLYFVHIKAEEYNERFVAEAESLESYKDEYGEDLIKHLQYIIKSQHIPAEQVTSSLPCKELIDKDKQQLGEIATRTRIFMGMCQPISYQMIESLATGDGLDYYPDQPTYLINGETKVATTFTKEEFLGSIKKRAELSAEKQLKKI